MAAGVDFLCVSLFVSHCLISSFSFFSLPQPHLTPPDINTDCKSPLIAKNLPASPTGSDLENVLFPNSDAEKSSPAKEEEQKQVTHNVTWPKVDGTPPVIEAKLSVSCTGRGAHHIT